MLRTSHYLHLLISLGALSMARAAPAQESPPADPGAMKAFADLVAAWRAMPALEVKTKVKIEVMEGDVAASGEDLQAEFVFGPKRQAVVKLRGFTCYLSKTDDAESGSFAAVHENDPNNYFMTTDDGSPYYALLNSFVDMPFPELAIMLGEDDVSEVLMQLHPKAPWLQPTAVKDESRDDKALQFLTLSSEFTRFELVIDPESRLILSGELAIAGGDLVRDGATLIYRYTHDYRLHDKPLDAATFKFDPGQRQKVDLMAALLPAPPQRDAGEAIEGGGGGEALVGRPAPPVTLATADGKAFDLADAQGRVVVLDFWASWCGPCMQGLPNIHELARWASDEQLPVTVMTINVWEVRPPNPDSPDARLASALKTWEKKKFTLPIAMDYTDETAGAYGVQGIPTTVIIRSDGVVHDLHVGVVGLADLKASIEAAIKAVEPGV